MNNDISSSFAEKSIYLQEVANQKNHFLQKSSD